MKRTFNTETIAKIKNKGEKDFHLPKYRNRSQTSETIEPEQELPFELSEFGSAVYYYRNTKNFDVETKDLYSDGEGPEPPVEKKYIYEKGEDSDVAFYLTEYDGSEEIQEGTNLTVNDRYDIHTVPETSCDFYVNGIYIGADILVAFTLTEDMSVDNKVIITVKRHGGSNPKLRVKNSNSYMTSINTYTDDYQFIGVLATFPQGQSGEVEIPLNTIIGINGMIFQARFSGTYGGIEYNNQQLNVAGYVYSPEDQQYWTNFQEGDEGNLTT